MAVRGVSVDDNTIRSVLVNGRPARSVAGNFLEWEAEVEVKGASGPMTVAAWPRTRRETRSQFLIGSRWLCPDRDGSAYCIRDAR